MKRWVIAAALLAATATTQAQEGLGVGVIVAEPTGLSAKYWLNDTDALDFAVAWSFSGDNSLQLHGDYLLHRFDLFPVDEHYGTLPLYFGIGGRFKDQERRRGDDDDDKLGVRVPVGVSYVFRQAPFDVFGEVVPVLDLIPDTELDLNIAIGGRFYFGRVDELR